MDNPDSRQSTASHSDPGALLILEAFFKGALMASHAYDRALLQVAQGGSHQSLWRRRLVSEAKKFADENLNRETFFYRAVLTIYSMKADPGAVQTYNAMAERERRQTRTIQDKRHRLEELRQLAEVANVALCDYCWKIFTPGEGVSPTICSPVCRKGLWNRSEYLKRCEALT
jgi:hypothetical protein